MNTLKTAQSILLAPYNLGEDDVVAALGQMMRPGVDDADAFFQSSYSESWVLEEGIIKEGSYSIDSGFGLRTSSGEKTGYAFTNDFNAQSLSECADAAASVVKQGQSRTVNVKKRSLTQQLYPNVNPLKSINDSDKINALREVDRIARAQDSRVCQVMASLGARYDVVLTASSETGMVADIRPLVRLNVTVVVEDKERREQGSAGGGGRYDYTRLFDKGAVESYAKDAVRQALLNLNASPAPAGVMPVVLGPGWPGVLLHEAVGHGLEGDFNRKKSSVFSGRLGERVATSLCTVVDDGTVPERRGSSNMDDEGTPMEKTVLIEKGILKGYMLDKLNARLMGMRSTGNGRRESYAYQPIPRMTNTYMLPGEHAPEDIIASVDRGLYAVNFGGGQVDITSGKFVFSTSEAYLIEKGKLKQPIKGATLAGSGPEILTKVSMVGNDLELDPGIGVCGKDGQGVPVGVGQPTVLVDELVVGGTE